MTFSVKGFKNRIVRRNLIFRTGVLAGVFLLLMFNPISALSIYADTLVITDGGAVNLIIGDSTVAIVNSTESQTLGLEVKAKEVNLVPERIESVVKVEPSKTDDKKVQVTVTQVPAKTAPARNISASANAPAPGSSQPQSGRETKSVNSPAPIVRQVDQVVAQGRFGSVVLSVNPAGKDSSGKGQVSINQGSVSATTTLPVQINSVSHSVSVVSSQGTQQNLSVLPKEALQDAVSKGLVNQDVPQLTSQETPALLVPEPSQQGKSVTVTPTASPPPTPSKTVIQILQNEPVYQISGDKTVNFLNLVKFKMPINVQISAKTGQVQSFTINIPKLFGF